MYDSEEKVGVEDFLGRGGFFLDVLKSNYDFED